MSTNNTEGINFKVSSMGREEVDNRPPCNLRPLTLSKLHAWIDGKSIDSRLKEELKKSASKYPQQALSTWQKRYSKHLANAQNALMKKPVTSIAPIVELGDEPQNTIVEDLMNVPKNNEFDDFVELELRG